MSNCELEFPLKVLKVVVERGALTGNLVAASQIIRNYPIGFVCFTSAAPSVCARRSDWQDKQSHFLDAKSDSKKTYKFSSFRAKKSLLD